MQFLARSLEAFEYAQAGRDSPGYNYINACHACPGSFSLSSLEDYSCGHIIRFLDRSVIPVRTKSIAWYCRLLDPIHLDVGIIF